MHDHDQPDTDHGHVCLCTTRDIDLYIARIVKLEADNKDARSERAAYGDKLSGMVMDLESKIATMSELLDLVAVEFLVESITDKGVLEMLNGSKKS
jgi:hypothetical protein